MSPGDRISSVLDAMSLFPSYCRAHMSRIVREVANTLLIGLDPSDCFVLVHDRRIVSIPRACYDAPSVF